MRFKDYLCERNGFDPDFDEEKFKKECAFYFEQMQGKKQLLLHGTNAEVIAGKKIPFRERDKPRDTHKELHEKVNQFFEKKFGKPFRNGLFVSGSQATANEFGHYVAFIVPIGRFEWLSSPNIRDMTFLYTKYCHEMGYQRYGTGPIRSYDEPEDRVLRDLENAQWFHNENLPKCVAGLSETMLWCPNGFYTFTYGNLPRSVLA